MKSPDEIKKGLECCPVCSKSCAYHAGIDCYAELHYDALTLIQQLERERDAAESNKFQYETGFVKGFEAAYSKWISVEDEPKQTSDYLVYAWVAYPDGIAQMEMRKAIYNIVHKEWYVDCGRLEAVGKPTHWMPLPEPPKEDE